MLATLLSAGDSTYRISLKEIETGISQVFLCIYPEVFGDKVLQQKLLNEIVAYTHDVEPMHPDDKIYYPGERSSQTRAKNMKDGMSVNKGIWEKIVLLAE